MKNENENENEMNVYLIIRGYIPPGAYVYIYHHPSDLSRMLDLEKINL